MFGHKFGQLTAMQTTVRSKITAIDEFGDITFSDCVIKSPRKKNKKEQAIFSFNFFNAKLKKDGLPSD